MSALTVSVGTSYRAQMASEVKDEQRFARFTSGRLVIKNLRPFRWDLSVILSSSAKKTDPPLSSISSSASTTTRKGAWCSLEDCIQGSTRRSFICLDEMLTESNLFDLSKAFAKGWEWWASWSTMVGMMLFFRLVSSNCREQKKFAPKIFGASCRASPPSSSTSCPSKWRATLYAIVDLPDPASPVNQKTDGLLGERSSAHS